MPCRVSVFIQKIQSRWRILEFVLFVLISIRQWWPYSANHQPPAPQWANLTLLCDDPVLFNGINDRYAVAVPPPPPVYSRYSNDSFQVVYLYGNITSSIRTPDQLTTARWWQESGGFEYYTPVMRAINAGYPSLSIEATLRALFLVSASTFDSNIMQYNYKLTYLQWRPWQRFARETDPTAQSEFELNLPGDWKPQTMQLNNPSPNHPDYPAGHPMSVGAWTRAFELSFPDQAYLNFAVPAHYDRLVSVVDPTEIFDLYYDNLMEFHYEIIMARIWVGYHTPHAGIQGHIAGIASAENCFKKLSPFFGPSSY